VAPPLALLAMSAAALLLRRRGAALPLLRALMPLGRAAAGAACQTECAAAPPLQRSLHGSASALGASAHSTAAPGVVSAQQMRGAPTPSRAHAALAHASARSRGRRASRAVHGDELGSHGRPLHAGQRLRGARGACCPACAARGRPLSAPLLSWQVRMTPDLRRAYIRWDAVPGQVARTERKLAQRYVRSEATPPGFTCMLGLTCRFPRCSALCRYGTRWRSWWG